MWTETNYNDCVDNNQQMLLVKMQKSKSLCDKTFWGSDDSAYFN